MHMCMRANVENMERGWGPTGPLTQWPHSVRTLPQVPRLWKGAPAERRPEDGSVKPSKGGTSMENTPAKTLTAKDDKKKKRDSFTDITIFSYCHDQNIFYRCDATD